MHALEKQPEVAPCQSGPRRDLDGRSFCGFSAAPTLVVPAVWEGATFTTGRSSGIFRGVVAHFGSAHSFEITKSAPPARKSRRNVRLKHAKRLRTRANVIRVSQTPSETASRLQLANVPTTMSLRRPALPKLGKRHVVPITFLLIAAWAGVIALGVNLAMTPPSGTIVSPDR